MKPSTNIHSWLEGIDLGELAAVFEENHITPDVLPTLTADDFLAMGIASLGHRKRLLAAITGLSAPAAPSAPPAPAAVRVPSPAPFAPQRIPLKAAAPVVRKIPAPAPAPVIPRQARNGIGAVGEPAPTPVPVIPQPAVDPQPSVEFPSSTVGTKSKRKAFSAKFLTISVCVHLILGIGGGYWVVQRIEAKRKLQFAGGPPTANPNKRALEHKVSLQKKKNAGGSPAQAKRIAVTGLAAKITLPDMPAVPTTSTQFVAGRMAGMGGAGFGSGLGFGNGSGMGVGGSGGGGGLTMFGARGGGGLAGTFYDLKQTRSGQPSGVNAESYNKVVREWVAGGLRDTTINKYFQAPQKLYATQFLMPSMAATEAPKAYGVEKEVKPSQWIAHYKGKISPPKSGTYQFTGAGDDTLVVFINHKLVLDGSWFPVSELQPASIDPKGAYQNHPRNGYVKGTPVTFTAGQWYDIDVLIGEQPGGLFFACLCAVEAGQNDLPLFRVSSRELPDIQNPPPCKTDSPIWRLAVDGGMMEGIRR